MRVSLNAHTPSQSTYLYMFRSSQILCLKTVNVMLFTESGLLFFFLVGKRSILISNVP
ncbi:hypothetical protein BCR42DRAFT_59930 [Absidia repens]|uniref:Uncharacterized protein n=1 Tax=Absidia repens TaxID=90262 RepID=A0A1X2ICR8_9FUNG|nr:hypothetical protein BCR42DRAFT_59930 [Absidia repens]